MSTIFGKRILVASTSSIVCTISASALYYSYQTKASAPASASASSGLSGLSISAKMLPTYQATFFVPLSCDSCVNDISTALSALPGIQSTSFSLPSQIVTTTGTAAPSSIISTIQSTGRPAILRGSGSPNSTVARAIPTIQSCPSTPSFQCIPPKPNTIPAAAVCILETPPTSAPSKTSPIRGLIRLIQLAPTIATATLLDLSVSDLRPGAYRATLRRSGDISHGAASMGALHRGSEGELGRVLVGEDGRGKLVGEIPWVVSEMVGRGVVVERVNEDDDDDGDVERRQGQRAAMVVVGVVARSAGAWENDKVVCACSGKTVWEERDEMVAKGIV